MLDRRQRSKQTDPISAHRGVRIGRAYGLARTWADMIFCSLPNSSVFCSECWGADDSGAAELNTILETTSQPHDVKNQPDPNPAPCPCMFRWSSLLSNLSGEHVWIRCRRDGCQLFLTCIPSPSYCFVFCNRPATAVKYDSYPANNYAFGEVAMQWPRV